MAAIRLGMTMGVFVIDGGDNWKTSLASGQPAFHETFLKSCRAAIEVGKRVNALGHCRARIFRSPAADRHTDRARHRQLARGRGRSRASHPHHGARAVERHARALPAHIRPAYAICRAVNSPACKILYDMYHMQRNEGDIIANIDLAWSEIAYFQVGDNRAAVNPARVR